ncbi:protein FAR1-RELATED SEQUENCE 5-like isoform X3 [Triticum urartu]|uniref:protein FAR1-RELATED SEQUENCE 5-like isoform X3 n=1 Tax=Triticum urartu TaxID=4572 RepID=UPI002043ED8B|nr:protein FAR1-RELATED SEQUENCE 5-like isoform X3 [Triticum urartu]
MESMASAALSIGSTTAVGVEDDASSSAVGMIRLVGNDENTYNTPKRTTSLPFCGSTYEPECDDNLKPVIGMKFDTWEEGMALYKMYAHEVGFSVRTWTTHKDDQGVPVWKRFVCAREGWRKVATDEERIKPKRNFKLSRCGCEAMIGFKRQDDGKYEVARFVQSHTHQLISPKSGASSEGLLSCQNNHADW